MKAPRISIAGMVVVVAIVALDCAAIRFVVKPPAWIHLDQVLVVFAWPVVDALAVGAFLLIRRSPQVRLRSPFLWGFEVTGLLTLMTFASRTIFQMERFKAAMLPLVNPVFEWASGLIPDTWMTRTAIFSNIFEFVMAFVIFSTPQLLAALIGGAITRMCWLARAGRREAVASDTLA